MIELEAENFRVAYWRPDEHLNFFFFSTIFSRFRDFGTKSWRALTRERWRSEKNERQRSIEEAST